jgi:hypothetical protein
MFKGWERFRAVAPVRRFDGNSVQAEHPKPMQGTVSDEKSFSAIKQRDLVTDFISIAIWLSHPSNAVCSLDCSPVLHIDTSKFNTPSGHAGRPF